VQPVAELAEVLAEVVELVHGEVAQRPLPAPPGILVVERGVAPHRVDLPAQLARLRDEGVHRSGLR
jgi:hypothetical protein